MASDQVLRRSLFGGFKRADVIDYIEKLQIELDNTQKTLVKVQKQNKKLKKLESENEKTGQLQSQVDSLNQTASELQSENENLKREIDGLYRNLAAIFDAQDRTRDCTLDLTHSAQSLTDKVKQLVASASGYSNFEDRELDEDCAALRENCNLIFSGLDKIYDELGAVMTEPAEDDAGNVDQITFMDDFSSIDEEYIKNNENSENLQVSEEDGSVQH